MIRVHIDKNWWGICLFDRYCYTSIDGFEKLN